MSRKYPKVMIGCPISEVKGYSLPQYLANVSCIQYPNKEYYFVDNSRNKEYADYIKELGFDVGRVYPKGKVREFVAESQNKILVKFLRSDCDYLFMVECDQFPKFDVLSRLMSHDLPVVGASYYINSGTNTRSVAGNGMVVCGALNIRHLSVKESFYYTGKGLFQVRTLGLGCILIRKDAFSNVKFRVQKDSYSSSDTFFHEDLWRNDIPVYLDSSIVVHHASDGWGGKYGID